MPLKTILDTLEGVPEALHEFYEEKDGKFVLDVEGVDDHPAVGTLRNAYDRVKADRQRFLDENKQLKAKVEGIPEDFDADEWARLKAEEEARQADPDNKDVRQQIEAATASVRTQLEGRIAKQKKDFETQVAERDERIADLEGQIRTSLVEESLTKALNEAGVKPSLLRAARALLERDVEVVDEDGRMVAKMKPELGGDEVGKYVTNWAASDEGKDFMGAPSGSGASGSRQTHPSESNPFGERDWNMTAQGQLIRSDRAKAERLAKAAGFKTLDEANRATAPIKK